MAEFPPRERQRRQFTPIDAADEITLIENSFGLLVEHGDAISARFYERLFSVYPELAPLFENVSQPGQQKKLLASMVLLVQNLRQPEVIEDYLISLGARHQQYGIQAADFEKFSENWLAVLAEFSGESWTSQLEQAWHNLFKKMAALMLPQDEAMEKKMMTGTEQTEQVDVNNQINSAFDGMTTPIMMVDRDFNITYANKATYEMLAKHESAIKSEYPSFDLNSLVGSNIDIFHKDPAHQRQMMNDPKNLPHSTEIKIGPLDFKLDVTAQFANGEHIGNTLEWTYVTDKKLEKQEIQSQLDAIDKSMGVISFDLDGTILDVNENFLNVVDYRKEEVVGHHHRMFVDNDYAKSREYKQFWADLARGEYQSGEYKRLSRNGEEVWLQATYNPVFDTNGNPVKVIKYAQDITKTVEEKADFQGQLQAIDRSMGVITFDLSGHIQKVNQNFLNVVGYTKDELIGKHHRMLVSDDYASSAEYRGFWDKLNQGEFDGGEYQRIAKDGRVIWLQANYNPIFDSNGKLLKIVKYAQDITKEKRDRELIERIVRSTSIVMGAMAEGDLTKTVEGEYEGELAELQSSINESIERIGTVVSEIFDASQSISSAASEISQGNTDLSQRTEEQASSLQETAASMEELTSTVRQNADNTRQANQLATTAREQAEKGGEVIDKAIKAMSEINASSKKVADIIGVIDEIAFQTNLLALNAAVEAARAGEQGRGFAVVASEVRNLAQRSATAAKEIKSLINDSGEKVKEGSSLVDQTGDALEEIVSGAKKVGDIISEISAAGDEQSAGIEQVNTAVTQMDEMTQQNAALVEQAASASEALDEQGKSLQKMMAFFNTGRELGELPTSELPKKTQSTRPVSASRPPAARKPTVVSAGNHRSQAANANDEEWDEF